MSSLEEALESLTVGEVKTIERHYAKAIESGITGTELTSGVILMLERRTALSEGRELPGWDEIDTWSMKRVNDYFAPAEIEVNPAEPETDEGKDAGLAA